MHLIFIAFFKKLLKLLNLHLISNMKEMRFAFSNLFVFIMHRFQFLKIAYLNCYLKNTRYYLKLYILLNIQSYNMQNFNVVFKITKLPSDVIIL